MKNDDEVAETTTGGWRPGLKERCLNYALGLGEPVLVPNAIVDAARIFEAYLKGEGDGDPDHA